MLRRLFLAGVAAAMAACAPAAVTKETARTPAGAVEEAVFAGGCFWCAEHDFDKVKGVIDVESGYAGGQTPNPTYQNHEGHLEVVRVRYDSAVISYAQLVEAYWPLVDAVDGGGQFCDRGPSYRPAILATPAQAPIAEASKAVLSASGRLSQPIAVEILPVGAFWRAEEYHQDYAKKNSVQYNFYRFRCGRDQRLAQLWGAKR
jgi:peptide-methionine (S)-S-oxide reductase